MSDMVQFALLTACAMTAVGVGVHFGERWIDRQFQFPSPTRPLVLPPRPASGTEWQKAIEPFVKRCTLASTLNMNLTLKADGPKALAELLVGMARELDHAGVKVPREATSCLPD